MRSLEPAKLSLTAGSFRGPLPPVLVQRPILARLTQRKRWIYLALARPPFFVGLAIVDLGYVSNTFAFAYNADSATMLADVSAIAPYGLGEVADTFGPGGFARFDVPGHHAQVRHIGGELEVSVKHRNFELQAHINASDLSQALSAMGPVPDGDFDATEKHALRPLRGRIKVAGAEHVLDGGVAGWDYTHGYLARHTKWRWAYFLGRAKSGESLGLNLVEGFLGERECGVWLDGKLFPVGEGRFSFQASAPKQPWTITTDCGNVNLRFQPGAIHQEKQDLGVIRSNFLQPVGTYTGTVCVDGRTFEVDRALGVAEDQDVLW